jgi:hypothetical protein
MAEFYKQSEHGPFDEVPLDRRYCVLQGSYVLCPALEYGERSKCTAFEGELIVGKTSLYGLMDNKRPVLTPLRLDECIESRCAISLILVRREPLPEEDPPEE